MFAFVGESGYTRHPSPEPRTQRLTRRNRWRFGWGRYHYPRHVLHVHEHPRAGCQNGKLCRFCALIRCAPEERREPAEQRCAYARRCSAGVAAPLGCVIFFCFCRNCGLYALRSELSMHMRDVWYHYPRYALRVIETPDGRLQKRLICRFLRSGDYLCFQRWKRL